MTEWFTRLILNLTSLALCVFFAWLTIRALRQGEDFYAAFGVAMTLTWAHRFAQGDA